MCVLLFGRFSQKLTFCSQVGFEFVLRTELIQEPSRCLAVHSVHVSRNTEFGLLSQVSWTGLSFPERGEDGSRFGRTTSKSCVRIS